MRLLTVGDSFTYGEELSDLNNAWPNLLAQHTGYDLMNLGRPGTGNTSMVRNCVEQVRNYDLAIVAWSHFGRIEMADENGIYDIWPGSNILPHKQHSSWRTSLIEYITQYHDDTYLYRQYLLNIILLQNFFKSNNKKYLMIDSFGNHKVKNQRNKFNRDLTTQIDHTYYLGWANESMMEWTYKTPQGPGGHFLDEGHAIVADKIYEHIRNLGWIS